MSLFDNMPEVRKGSEAAHTKTRRSTMPDLREENIQGAFELIRHLADHANGITLDRLTKLWSAKSTAEIAEVVDKLAFVVDWIGLS
jgi:hypothetical protein